MEPQSEHEGKLYYTQEQLQRDVYLLFQEMPGELNRQTDVIIGVSRGGLVPAVMLSHLTGLDMVPLRWSFRDSPGGMMLEASRLIRTVTDFRRIFIVEDICDTGKTIKTMQDVLAGSFHPSLSLAREITFMCLWKNTQNTTPVDVVAREIDREVDRRFIVFPWEECL